MAMDEMAGAAEEPTAGTTKPARKTWRSGQNGGPAGGGAVYGIGMIGALVYFFGSAQSGRDYVLALPRATLWPALLVYKLLKHYDV